MDSAASSASRGGPCSRLPGIVGGAFAPITIVGGVGLIACAVASGASPHDMAGCLPKACRPADAHAGAGLYPTTIGAALGSTTGMVVGTVGALAKAGVHAVPLLTGCGAGGAAGAVAATSATALGEALFAMHRRRRARGDDRRDRDDPELGLPRGRRAQDVVPRPRPMRDDGIEGRTP